MNNNQTIEKMKEAFNYYDNKEENIKHLKGYMYDSLIYRYKEALYKAHLYDAEQNKESFRKELYFRDLMRFIQILDEAIGPHD